MQMQQQQKPRRHRWRMNIGEWMVLFLNILLTGFSGWIGILIIVLENFYPRTPPPSYSAYLEGGSCLLVALGGCLTSLLLLLRQTRLAAWFQWLVMLGCCLFAGIYFVFERQRNSLQENLWAMGAALLMAVVFVFSGRFLRSIDDNK
jgi:drug/metabolite transporter (DMT)-like permease